MLRGMFDNYYISIILKTEYKGTSIYTQSEHKKMYLLECLFGYIFCERNLELILIDQPNLDERTTEKRDHLSRLATLIDA